MIQRALVLCASSPPRSAGRRRQQKKPPTATQQHTEQDVDEQRRDKVEERGGVEQQQQRRRQDARDDVPRVLLFFGGVGCVCVGGGGAAAAAAGGDAPALRAHPHTTTITRTSRSNAQNVGGRACAGTCFALVGVQAKRWRESKRRGGRRRRPHLPPHPQTRNYTEHTRQQQHSTPVALHLLPRKRKEKWGLSLLCVQEMVCGVFYRPPAVTACRVT